MPSKSQNFTVRDAAAQLSCTITYVFQLLWTNRFPGAYKRNRAWLIPAADLQHYKKEQLARKSKGR